LTYTATRLILFEAIVTRLTINFFFYILFIKNIKKFYTQAHARARARARAHTHTHTHTYRWKERK